MRRLQQPGRYENDDSAAGGPVVSARILVIFGTRPEAIKLFPVIQALKREASLDVRVCLTGQHGAMVDDILALTAIVPDIDLAIMQPGQSLDTLTARLLSGIGETLDTERPDRIVVQGDTASAMVGALAGYYRKIPVSHVEAGLRSHDIHHPWPEEVNRKIVATIADQHFAPTATAAAALRAEAIDPATIYQTGNTVIDALQAMRDLLGERPALAAKLDAVADGFAGRRIIAVTTHRRENFEALRGIAEALTRIASRSDVGIIFPIHPNPIVREAMTSLAQSASIAVIEPLDYPSFVRLLDRAHLVLTDSGGIQEEAPSFGKPVLVMRETTERPEGVAAGTAKLVGADPDAIVRETSYLLDDALAYEAMARAHSPYGDGRASERIAKVIVDAS